MVYLNSVDWSTYSSFLFEQPQPSLPPTNNLNNKSNNNTNTFTTNLPIFHYIYNRMSKINSLLYLGCPELLSTAMIYFHKFFIQNNSSLKNIPILYFCSACLFIATKVTNRLTRINDFCKIVSNIISEKAPNSTPHKDIIKQNIINCEHIIITSIGFDVEVDLPYKFLYKVNSYFEKNLQLNVNKVMKACCYYLNDSFVLPLCLYYVPDVIAIACVIVMSRKYGIGIREDEVIELSEFNVSKNDVNVCVDVIERMYMWKKGEEGNDNNKTKEEGFMKRKRVMVDGEEEEKKEKEKEGN